VIEPNAVAREVRVEARPERVFAFFVDPGKMALWMGSSAELDPRPGGVCRVHVIPGNVARGEYVEVVPFSRVVFTWGWEGDESPVPPGGSTVEVTLTPDGDATIVRLVHRDLPTPEARSAHAEGWAHFLARLGIVGAGGDPGPDPWAARA
jgi:uncharacterized protein YndB with AHSA1/START domain